MIRMRVKGDLKRTRTFTERFLELFKKGRLDAYGRQGVESLSSATPVDTGKSAESWSYEIVNEKDKTQIIFSNSNIQNGIPVVVLLQYGHATKSGGWVEGIDFINPALKPLFNDMIDAIWKEAKRL